MYLKEQRKLNDSAKLMRYDSCIDECKAIEQSVEDSVAYCEHWSMYKHGSTTPPLIVVCGFLLLLLLRCLGAISLTSVMNCFTFMSISTCHVVVSSCVHRTVTTSIQRLCINIVNSENNSP